MMGIIDGTGAFFNDTYKKDFTHSYCRQMAEALTRSGSAVLYQRGPSSLGLETGPYARRIVDWVKGQHAARPREPVFLMGYSRGAAAVVSAASFLRSEAPDLRVAAMFLFDAVDRSIFTDAEVVPANVLHCHHAVRDYSFVTWFLGRHQHNRWYFNSDALTGAAGVEMDLTDPPINGSHGAMGGTPWADDARDPGAVIRVADWMNPRLTHHGLPRALDPARCYPQGSAKDQRVERILQRRRSGGLPSRSVNGLPSRSRGR